MDSRTATQERLPATELDGVDRRSVFFLKVDAAPAEDRERSANAEEFEIGIGSWRAKIVKQADDQVGRSRFQARFEAAPREVWARRRMQRLAERLNARRRLSD